MSRRPLCLYDDTSRWPLDHPVLKNGTQNNRLLGFRPQPPSNYDEIRRRLLAMSSGMGLCPRPASQPDAEELVPWPSRLQCLSAFEPHKKFGDGPLLSGPCIIIMTLPTTDDIWITAPLFQYPSLPPFDHSTINYIFFGLRLL